MFAECFLASRARVELVLKLEPLLRVKAKANQRAGGQSSEVGRQKSDKPLDTKRDLAKAAGVSHDTISKGKVIEAKASNSPMPLQRALVPRWLASGVCLDRIWTLRNSGTSRGKPGALAGVKYPLAGA